MLDVILMSFMASAPEVNLEADFSPGVEVELSAAAIPQQVGQEEAPEVTAEGVLVFDATSATVLYEKNADEPMPIASLTKLMTALVAVDELGLEEMVYVPSESRREQVQYTKVLGLPVGGEFFVRDVLGGMLISSAADAAVTLAVNAAGDETTFVSKMNEKARGLNLQKMSFQDVFGLSVGDLSTAREMNWLFAYAWKKEALRGLMGLDKMDVCMENGLCYVAKTTNLLLGGSEFQVLGGKTGTTDAAGECLVMAVKTPRGATLVLTMLKSDERWSDAKLLLQWVFDNFRV